MELGLQFVLTPERYNPKRRMDISDDDGVLLSDIISLSDNTITMKNASGVECYQINTSDAMGGYLKIPQQKVILNSNKKILQQGDVIISRLRPYLRQVAYVDIEKKDGLLVASTEFYVMRSRNNKSIAFLVPFLLSDVVQNVFVNSVEGSQHPRFKEDDLLNLVVPRSIFDARDSISKKIVNAIQNYRIYENGIIEETSQVNAIFSQQKK